MKNENYYNSLKKNIIEEYAQSDLCMSELLADVSADGLSIEQAFELYVELREYADDDVFYCNDGTKLTRL